MQVLGSEACRGEAFLRVRACARARAPTCLSLCVSVARLVGASGEASGKPVVWGEGSRRGLAAGRKQDLSSRAACGCRSACSRVRRVPVRAQGDGRRPPRAPWRLRLLCSRRGRETPPLSRYSFAPRHWELGDPSPGLLWPLNVSRPPDGLSSSTSLVCTEKVTNGQNA